MGLDARVYCNCWVQGLTTPPPVAREKIYFSESGWLTVDIPGDDEHLSEFMAFDSWEEECCPHPNMAYASVRVSNWSGYRIFQAALARAGWEYFPTLHAQLPRGNDGSTPASYAPGALEELNYFRRKADLGTNVFLVDTETGESIKEYTAAYDGIFMWVGSPPPMNLGFDARGLFIESANKDQMPSAQSDEATHSKILFRAMRVEQRILEPEKTDNYERGQVEYMDLDSGARFMCTSAVSEHQVPWPDGRMEDDKGRVRSHYPRYLHVEERPITSEHFSYILDPLEEIFRASIETGNPVLWA